MHPILRTRAYLICHRRTQRSERSGLDVYELATGDRILECREGRSLLLNRALGLLRAGRMAPVDLRLSTPIGEPVLRILRRGSVLGQTLALYDELNRRIGALELARAQQGEGRLLAPRERVVAELSGPWQLPPCRFLDGPKELARAELSSLSSAPYAPPGSRVLRFDAQLAMDAPTRAHMLAAALCLELGLQG